MTSSSNAPVDVLSLELRSAEASWLTESPLRCEELHPEIARTLFDRARSADEKCHLAIRFVVPGTVRRGTEDPLACLVRNHFQSKADAHARQIRDIFRYARVSTLVGLLVVTVLLGSAQGIPEDSGKVMSAVRESLTIFAWVAMWRPAELWLYDHLPERHWRRLSLRLANASISLVPESASNSSKEPEARGLP